MKQKTAIRQLIEFAKFILPDVGTQAYQDGFHDAIEVIITKAESLESVNEQQIKDAFCTTLSQGKFRKYNVILKEEGDQYFNDTFEKP